MNKLTLLSVILSLAVRLSGKNGLWKVSSEGAEAKQILKGIAEHPKWSPDGTKIAFTRTQGRNFDIWVMEVDKEKIKKELQVLR